MWHKLLFVSLIFGTRFFTSETIYSATYFCKPLGTARYYFVNVTDQLAQVDFWCNLAQDYDYTEISFLSSKISKIPNELFSEVRNIRKLVLVDCDIEQVSRSSLAQAKRLTALDLSRNKITELRNYAFEGASDLSVLNLTANNISFIEDKSFHSMKALHILLLGGNSLKYLSAEVMVELTALESIVLVNNQLHKLEKGLFTKNKALKIVQLQNNYLTTFEEETICEPKECGNFHLNEILLNNNSIKQLSLPNIDVTVLKVKNNLLVKIRISTALQELHCSHNEISEIVIDNAAHSQLHTLDITNNSVSSLEYIAQLHNLRTLYLGFNPLNPLNVSSFGSLTKLKTLGLEETKISNLQHGILGHQEQLEWLDLSFNNLDHLDMLMLASCANLKTLYLDGNRLESIDYEEMKNYFPMLQLLGIAGNDWNCTYLAKIVRYCSTQSIEINKPLFAVPQRDQPKVRGIYCLDDKHTTHNWTATIKELHIANNDSGRSDDTALIELFQSTFGHSRTINQTSRLEATILDLKKQQFQLQEDLNTLRDTLLYAQPQMQSQLSFGNTINDSLMHNNNIMAAVLFMIGLNLTFIVGFVSYWIYRNRNRSLFTKYRRNIREGCTMTTIIDDQI